MDREKKLFLQIILTHGLIVDLRENLLSKI